MNTRLKVLSLIVIFFFSFVIIQALFSSDGFIANKVREKRITALEEEITRRESDLSSMRHRASTAEREKDTREKSLVYSFDDDSPFNPNDGRRESQEMESYSGLSIFSSLLIALFVTILYGLAVILIPSLRRMRKKGVRDGRDY